MIKLILLLIFLALFFPTGKYAPVVHLCASGGLLVLICCLAFSFGLDFIAWSLIFGAVGGVIIALVKHGDELDALLGGSKGSDIPMHGDGLRYDGDPDVKMHWPD